MCPCSLHAAGGSSYQMLCPGHIQLLAVAAYKVQKGRIVFGFFHSIGKNGVNKTQGQVVPLVTS